MWQSTINTNSDYIVGIDNVNEFNPRTRPAVVTARMLNNESRFPRSLASEAERPRPHLLV